MLQEVLIPGELSITEQAFSQMLMDLRNGESVSDSLTSFCTTVLHEPN